MKKQLWLRPDQVDLLSGVLLLVHDNLGTEIQQTSYREKKTVYRYTKEQLTEILKMLGKSSIGK